MKLFQKSENSLYQWQAGKYVVDIIYKKEQGFFVIIKESDDIVARILEHEIENLNVYELKKLQPDAIKVALETHYPAVSHYSDGGYRLTFHVRGLGGWKEEIHYGQTIQWCMDVGMSRKQATIVAQACNGIDSGGTDPVMGAFSKGAQSWHFNKYKHPHDGDPHDSRIKHAVKNLNLAIDAINSDAKKFKYKRKGHKVKVVGTSAKEWLALHILGEGLHPLQDLFAHIKRFVETYGSADAHLFHMKADKPRFIDDKDSPPSLDFDKDDKGRALSQRYTNTKLLTKFYIKRFLDRKPIDANEFSSKVKEALAISHKPNEQNQVALMKRFQHFKQDLGLRDEPDFDAIDNKLAMLMNN